MENIYYIAKNTKSNSDFSSYKESLLKAKRNLLKGRS